MILVDASVWVGYLRGDERPAVARLAGLLDRGSPVAVAAIVAQELLQGVGSGPAFDRLERFLSSQWRLEPADPWHVAVEAARMSGACRAAGVTVHSTLDCLIARIAIEHGVALLHDDGDFGLSAGVVPGLRLT